MEALTALVTGGSKGLGAEIALALGGLGMRVAVNYRTDSSAAGEVADMLGDDALLINADVSDLEAAEAMAGMLRARFGGLGVLVCNAGITRDSLLPRATEDDWDAVIGTNLKGCYNVCRACVPLMTEEGGHIVLVSSRSGLKGKAGQAAYASSKAALIGFGLSLARELAPDNIRVNMVVPPYMDTDMGAEAVKAMDMARGDSLLDAIGDTSEVASFITWLVNTERITGQVFTLDSRI